VAITAAVVAGVAVAGVAASAVLKNQAGKKQASANKKAARNINEFRAQVLEFQQQIYDDSQPFRDISLAEAERGKGIRDQTVPHLLSDLLGPETPGERGYGADFDLAAKEGLDRIQKDFAVTGSPSSGSAQIAAGRFTTGLVANEQRRIFQERQARINNIFRLSGIGGTPAPTTGVAESLNALGQAGDLTRDSAGLQIQQGAIEASQWNNWANLASDVGSIASSYGGGFGGAGGGGGAINPGGFNLSQLSLASK
jgi:hypothetical protein